VSPRARLAVPLLLAGLLGLLALPALASEGASWGTRPADGAHGSARENFRYSAAPGDLVTDVLEVSNLGSAPLSLRVLGADGELTAEGLVELAPAGAAPEGLASWLALGAESLVLAPGESSAITFTIAVPADAVPGEHAGALVTSSLEAGEQLTVDRRLATSIVVQVEEPAARLARAPGGPAWAWAALGVLALGAVLAWRPVWRARARG